MKHVHSHARFAVKGEPTSFCNLLLSLPRLAATPESFRCRGVDILVWQTQQQGGVMANDPGYASFMSLHYGDTLWRNCPLTIVKVASQSSKMG